MEVTDFEGARRALAASEVAWRSSEQFLTFQKRLRVMKLLAGGMIVVGLLLSFAARGMVNVAGQFTPLGEAVTAAGGLLMLVPIGLWIYSKASYQVVRTEYFVYAAEPKEEGVPLGFAAEDAEGRMVSLLDRVGREVSKYNLQTQARASQSFFTSQLAMFVGFMWLLGWGLLAVLLPDREVRLASLALATVGSAVSAFINRTYVSAHRTSLSQLNYYYRQPAMTYLLLQAERVAQRVSGAGPDGKDDLCAEIVRLLMRVAERMWSSELAAHALLRADEPGSDGGEQG